MLSLIIGGTVYTFAIILAVFLTGLGIGSTVGAVVSRRTSPRLAFGVCQLLLAAAIAWATHQLATSLPYWPIDPSLLHNPWHGFQLDLVRCLWAVLPAAMLWGASFPLALGAISTRRDDPGKLVGRLYAANTLGAIIGSLSFSMIVVAWIGTQRAQQILIALAVCSALLALAPIVFSKRSVRDPAPGSAIPRRGLRTVLLGSAIAVASWLAWTVPPVPGELIANGRYLPQRVNLDKILYQGEGVNASVAVSLGPDQVRSFHVSGKIEASSSTQDMRLQRLLGHIPALMHPQPRSVLVVGCGAGVTAGSFLLHPDVERVVICEIEPLIPQVVAQYFSDENYNVVTDPRVEVVYDDARHFVLTTQEKFEVVTSDPIHPWVKGAATLYTQEYFELCKQRLKPGGVITQWVPLYESNAATVKSELATFSEVFPDSTIWSNDQDGQGYDLVVLGQVGPLKIDIEAFANRLKRDDHALVALSLAEVGFHSSSDLLATYAGAAADLKPWLTDAEINRDRNLRLQFIAGMSATYYHEWSIYDEILRYRRYPESLFHVSPAAQP